MRVAQIILLATISGPIALGEVGIKTADQSVIKIGKHTFTLPAGFEIELAAGPPLVDRPIVADSDEAGHLYVADSSGVNDKVEKQLAERPHRIVRLTDIDGDGVYDQSVVFADKMMFPEGLLWHDGAVYCAAPPSIWKLEDTDGDGVADRRTEWFIGGTLTGCANDLHGPYLGPAGWIYWTKGAFAKLDLELGDGSRLTSSAAHIFRARPDGSGLESYAAGGMDNPVDVTFGEAGDAFFSSTFLVMPANGRRDGLVHSIYGSVYPKRHGVIDALPRTGELMPAMSHLGPSASCGLATYRSGVFGPSFRGNLFSCLFNMRKVMRHRLIPDGATFASEDRDFVISDQVDFHPTDVQEDSDGSLLILDTGGWYKLCCPTSVIAKPEVLGGIYRVRRKNAKTPSDPRGARIDWAKLDGAALVALLKDSRPKVRDRAVASLARKGKDALGPLRTALTQTKSKLQALGALWSLARMRTKDSAGIIRLAFGSPFGQVQQAGAYVSGLERDGESLSGLMGLLRSPHPAIRREAATALGRLGREEACEALLACQSADRFLEHAIIYALIEIDSPAALRNSLPRKDNAGRPASHAMRVLWALNSMPGAQLQPEEAIALLSNETPVLPILERHPEWGPELATYYETFLRSQTVLAEREGRKDHCLNEFLHWPEVGKMVGDLLLEGLLQEAILQHVGDSILRPHPLPDGLISGLEHAVLKGKMNGSLLLYRLKSSQLTPRLERWLTELAESGARVPESDRHWAVDVLASCHRALPPKAFGERLKWIGSPEKWLAAAHCFSQARLSEQQRLELLEVLPKASVFELESLLKVYETGGSEMLGERLARTLAAAPASRSVSAESFSKLAAAFPQSVRQALLKARPADPTVAERTARLQEMEVTLPKGDRLKGHQVFRSTKAGCNACHRIAYDGGVIGPDLTRIGAIRSRRDLLEAIVAPSASYARGYEPVIVILKQGGSRMGIARRDGDWLHLRDVTGKEEVYGQAAIRDISRAEVSIMPSGLDQNMSRQELADLIAFLESLK